MSQATVHALDRARQALAAAETRAGVRSSAERVELGGLTPLFREGWAPGRVVSVQGATSAVFTAAAAAMGAEGWLAAVGMRDIGWAAAARAGIDLRRVVLVDAATADAVAVCVDAFDVVVLGDVALAPGERRSLEGRIRMRRTTVLTRGTWPGAAQVRAEATWTKGCGRGDGYLSEWGVHAERTDRPARVELRCAGRIAERAELAAVSDPVSEQRARLRVVS